MELQIAVDYGKMIQTLLEMIITALLPVVLGYIVVWIKEKTNEIKAKVSSENLAFAEDVVRRLVLAAEQSGLLDDAMKLGKEKKKFVISLAEAELFRKGINIDLDVLDALIEAEVFEAFSQFKTDPELNQK